MSLSDILRFAGEVDSRTSTEIMGILKDLNQTHDLTIIVVTHSDEVASFAARIITFRDGRVIADAHRPIAQIAEVPAISGHGLRVSP